MRFNALGGLVLECWQAIPKHFKYVELDEFVIMPNHLHGLLIIKNCKGEACLAPTKKGPTSKKGTIGSMIGSFKSSVSRRAKKSFGFRGKQFWQRSYYEHVVRNNIDLNNIREYIINNPARWDFDKENPDM